MSKPNKDTSLLKMDMRITAKRLKLKDKNVNNLPLHSNVFHKAVNLETFSKLSISHCSAPSSVQQKSTSKENMKSIKATAVRKKRIITRRPVNYTWNRGGRLKEIRIRTQARKFLYIWIKKTFGQITFSRAQSYHRKVLVLKCFLAWKSVWWDNCGEMKMWIRAEYFHRYKNYSKVWIAWTLFVKQSKKKKADIQLASEHYSHTACVKYTRLWKVYIQVRRVKKSFYNKAYTIAKQKLERKTWLAWINAVQVKRNNLDNQDIATCHWAETLQKKVWKIWLNRCNGALKLREQNIVVQRHYNNVLRRKALSSWCLYAAERRRKNVLYRTARSWHGLCLKHRTISIWLKRYEQVMDYQARMQQAYVLSIYSTRRRYLLVWTRYVEHVALKHRKQAIAIVFYRKQLLKNALQRLKLAVLLKENKIKMLYTAIHFYANSLISNSWRTWQQRLECIEEKDLQELTALANEHYRYAMLRKMISAFLAFTNIQKQRKRNAVKADAHFIVKALPRCFSNWRKFVDEIKDVNQMKKDAADFRREVLNTKYFYLWYNQLEQSRERRTMERMAMMQYRENALRQFFHIWSCQTRQILSASRKDAVARVHYRKALLKQAVRHWSFFTKTSQSRKRKLVYASSYHYNSILAGSWLSWKHYVTKCHEKKVKCEIATNHHAVVLLNKSMNSWKCYHIKANAIQSEANQRYKLKSQALMRSSLSTWRTRSIELAASGQAKITANRHRKRHLQLLAFKNWREWAVLHCYKKEQTTEQVNDSIAILNHFKLRRLFIYWNKSTIVAGRERLQCSTAELHFHVKLCKVAFQAWQLFRYMQLKKALMRRQANLFCGSRISRNFFSNWTVKLEEKRDEDSKTADALWHWATAVQGHCFDAWRRYITERKKKQERYNQAMDARRFHLVKKGCVKFLTYHSNMVAHRTRLAACHQAQMRYSAYHLAWKYGKRWISRVRKRMETKAARKPLRVHTTEQILPYAFQAKPIKSWFSPPIVTARKVTPLSSAACTPSIHETFSPKRRAAPRLPEFLDDSLRKDGLLDGFSTPPRDVQPVLPTNSLLETNVANYLPTECIPGPSTKMLPRATTSNHRFHSPPCSPHSSRNSSSSADTLVESSPGNTTPHASPGLESPSLPRLVSCETSITNKSPMVLLPPSAFTLPEERTPEPSSPTHPHQWSYLRDNELRGSGIGDGHEERKETSQTFIASPSQERDELSLIYAKLQDFQQKKNHLKVLKQQKEVLERWIDENLSTMPTSGSIDMAAVQEEITQIDEECHEISTELLRRKPEVEDLAVRVKVLCARPT